MPIKVCGQAIFSVVEEVAAASTRCSGQRVVLGAWQQGGGYIGEAIENGGIFFDTGDEVWEALRKSGVDPWLVNEAFLRRQLEAGVKRVDFASGNVWDTLLDPSLMTSYRVKELQWMLDNASKYGYELVGNSWIRKIP